MLILGIVAVVVVFWLISAYNGLIALRNQTANALKQIDVQLKRRHDLIPNLISSVQAAMDFEKDTLQAVISARNSAIQASAGFDPQHVKQVAAAETQLTGALGRFMAVVEAYPDLKATSNMKSLQEELASTENKVGFARQLYNDTATQYNTKQQQFPTNLVAGMANATPAELWEIEDAAERAVPKVEFRRGA
ncbi:LemA family protein [Pseudogemmatithrix spongiicola]|uniref:LemA family protein n=1 Tax=Pseudogemmatithrix spongiicola TaxID=3062599 RepID=A0AA49JZE9_9BACT|nr:LemA family protein [Gemmatimonadaceae bacterium 'strain 138']WKW14874.1 LemA family protein [Gemmatimonadaceae bacterium 'strain 318']